MTIKSAHKGTHQTNQSPVATLTDMGITSRDTQDRTSTLIAIPCYKEIGTIRTLVNSLVEDRDELVSINSEIYFIDDSPLDVHHSKALLHLVAKLKRIGIRANLLQNEKNLGFIHSCNKVLAKAEEAGGHCLLLNSDTVATKGFLSEMLWVLESDPMIGFVAPRSNNATICSIPTIDIAGQHADPGIERGEAIHAIAKGLLPRVTFVPTAVGFCLLIKNTIIDNFGFLDSAYGKGYDEENDLIMRSNRVGFRAALANHAYVGHSGSASFGDITRTDYQRINHEKLVARYPEYQQSISAFFRSPKYDYDRLVTHWASRKSTNQTGSLHAAIDMTWYTGDANGTTRLINKLLTASNHRTPDEEHQNIQWYLLASSDNIEIVEKISIEFPHVRVSEASRGYGFDTLFIPKQHFLVEHMHEASSRAIHLAYFWLDLIADDCLYLSTEEFSACSWIASRFSSALLFNSSYSLDLFANRYPPSAHIVAKSVFHSTAFEDYQSAPKRSYTAKPIKCNNSQKSIVIIGNQFKHKALYSTALFLAEAMIDISFTLLTSRPSPELKHLENIKYHQPGALSDQDYFSIMEEADVIVFPSYYEGFGFSLPESMSLGKTVLARDTKLAREIIESWDGPGAPVLYKSRRQLLSLAKELVVRDDCCSAQPSGRSSAAKGRQDPATWVSIFNDIESIVANLDQPRSCIKTIEGRMHILGIMKHIPSYAKALPGQNDWGGIFHHVTPAEQYVSHGQ